MPKLTLSIDEAVVRRAQRYAKQRGVSVSKLVEAYLQAVAEPADTRDDPPILRSLQGTLKDAGIEDYRRYLARKYR